MSIMKRGLQIVMAVLSLMPLTFAIKGILFGAAQHIDSAHVTPTIDSYTRYQSGFYLVLFMLIWWLIPQLEKQTAVFRIVVLAIFLGGLARLFSYLSVGPPPPRMIFGMVLALSSPLLILWQAGLKSTGLSDRKK
ncbi:MAG: DUF4345 domain-containing protein [Kofleriaceae bacterium]|nr:DUF4345 domain-containing protein [Kofleriaceae bacterium]